MQWTGPSPFKRVPLTAGQHILHLLLTVLTVGLWSPVWIVRAARGNPNPEYYRWLYWQRTQQMNAGPPPPPLGWQPPGYPPPPLPGVPPQEHGPGR